MEIPQQIEAAVTRSRGRPPKAADASHATGNGVAAPAKRGRKPGNAKAPKKDKVVKTAGKGRGPKRSNSKFLATANGKHLSSQLKDAQEKVKKLEKDISSASKEFAKKHAAEEKQKALAA